MISYEEFEDIVVNILKRDISSNHDQKKAIRSKANEGLFIVAGPGSGKTTVIVLKIFWETAVNSKLISVFAALSLELSHKCQSLQNQAYRLI